MKKLHNLLLFIFLSNQLLVASVPNDSSSVTQYPLNPEQWEQIVNYTNTEVTRFYIEFLIQNDDLEESDVKEFDNKLKVSVYNNEISDPIKFEKLNSLLESKFSRTLNNVSIPIDNLKSQNDKSSENLFRSIKVILDSVLAPEVYKNDDFKALHTKVNRHIETLNLFKDNRETNNSIEENLNKSWYEKGSFPIILLVSSCIFFLSSIVLIIRKPDRVLRSNPGGYKTQNGQATSNITPSINKFNNEEVEKSNQTIQKLQQQLNIANEKLKKFEIPIEIQKPISPKLETEDKKADNFTPPNLPEKSTSIYAGKPTENRVLKDISTQSDPQQTIFKLKILPFNNEVAEFEVFHVSDFMTRSITNSPDDYLYRVCNHENTNQEFRKEILTVKKGKANLVDGEWIVKEENKATIKFQ